MKHQRRPYTLTFSSHPIDLDEDFFQKLYAGEAPTAIAFTAIDALQAMLNTANATAREARVKIFADLVAEYGTEDDIEAILKMAKRSGE